jgi:hypothetical protein
MTFGVGEANSMNSKPMRPMGFSNRSAMIGSLTGCALIRDDVSKRQPGGAQEIPRTLRPR